MNRMIICFIANRKWSVISPSTDQTSRELCVSVWPLLPRGNHHIIILLTCGLIMVLLAAISSTIKINLVTLFVALAVMVLSRTNSLTTFLSIRTCRRKLSSVWYPEERLHLGFPLCVCWLLGSLEQWFPRKHILGWENYQNPPGGSFCKLYLQPPPEISICLPRGKCYPFLPQDPLLWWATVLFDDRQNSLKAWYIREPF